MVDGALAGVTGRHRELELRLQSCRFMATLLAPALFAEALGEAERFADLEGRTVGECELLLHVAIQRWMSGRAADDVAEAVERAVADPQLVAAVGADSAWLQLAIGQLFKTDRLDAARRTNALALAEARRRGSAPAFAAASAWRAWIALRSGAAADAEADARAACEAPSGTSWQRLYSACCLIDVLVERGELQAAQALLVASGGEGDDAAHHGGELLLSTRSNLRAARGDLHGALADQIEARRLQGDGLMPNPDFDGWLRIARLLHATGDEQARRARGGGRAELGAHLGHARSPRAGADRLRADPRRRRGRGAAARRRRAPRAVARAPRAGAVAGRAGRRDAALGPSGRPRASRCVVRSTWPRRAGSSRPPQRAREELRLTGARIRRPASSGLDSLTPSERRIVELASDGASNPEIAQALFVTVKTDRDAPRQRVPQARDQLAPRSSRRWWRPDKVQGASTGTAP